MNKSQKKNILIGGLIAIVLIMAVGYAAFATNLNISGTTNVTSKWHVHFNTEISPEGKTLMITDGSNGVNPPTGSYNFIDDQTVTITTTLNQPGDEVNYNFNIFNSGTIDAKALAPTVVIDGQSISCIHLGVDDGYLCTNSNNPEDYYTPNGSVMSYYVRLSGEGYDNDTIQANEEYNDTRHTMMIHIKFNDTNKLTQPQTSSITIRLNYEQA